MPAGGGTYSPLHAGTVFAPGSSGNPVELRNAPMKSAATADAAANAAGLSLMNPSCYTDFRVQQALLARPAPVRRIATKVLDSIYSWLGSDVPASQIVDDERLEAIRDHMLHLLQTADRAKRHRDLRQRIYCAPEATALWYLRAELMHVLSASEGERTARQRLLVLSRLFRGVLPDGLRSRSSPLEN